MTDPVSALGFPLLVAASAGLVAGVLGVPLVLRDLSLFGFGLAHAAFGGVALGLAAGLLPRTLGVASALGGALLVPVIRDRGGFREETALAAVTLGGLAAGLAVAALAGVPRSEVVGVLFGNPMVAGAGDAAAMGAVAAAGVGLFALLYKEIFYATFDREAATLAGVPTGLLDAALMAATAVTVVVAARVAGLLLVGVLLVLPAAAGLRVARTFRGAVLASAAGGVLVATTGVSGAWAVGLDNGAPVVLAGLALLGVAAALARAAGRTA